MFDSLRARLTIWYVAVLTVVLLLFSAGVYIVVQRTLYERLDSNLRSTLDTVVAQLARQAQSHPLDPATAKEAMAPLHFPRQTVAILDEHTQVLAEKTEGGVSPTRLPPPPFPSPATDPQFYRWPESRPDADDSCRGIYQRIADASSDSAYYVMVTQSLDAVTDSLDIFQNTLVVVALLGLLLAGIGGWFLTHRTLAPVAAMAESAQRITAENLEERLPIANPRDELGRLASSFNALLGRLSAAFAQQRQFMADASHELRTPLSVMRTAAQVTLERDQRPPSEYRNALAIVEQQTRRLSRIVEDMFTLARADSGGIAVRTAELYLDEVLSEAVHTASILAADKNIKLEMPSLRESPFRGDEGLLRRMFLNLLDNAVKFTPRGGVVRIVLELSGAEYRVKVSDTGIGIPPAARVQIFERFFRVDDARTQSDGNGAGLGLAIARWIAEVHKGRLDLQSSDETGSTFSVSLPRS